MFISVSETTLKLLRELREHGEDVDSVIRRLIEYHDQGVSAASGLLKPISDESKVEAEG